MIKYLMYCLLSLVSLNLWSEDQKINLLLICPHNTGKSSYSVYVIIDKNSPDKLLSVGLEELKNKNSFDNKYEEVINAQFDDNFFKEKIDQISINDINEKEINFKDILKFKLSKNDNGYTIHIDSKVSVDKNFIVGGKEINKRNITIEYSTVCNKWQMCTKCFCDNNNKDFTNGISKIITGLRYSAGQTKVSKIILVDNLQTGYLIYDR